MRWNVSSSGGRAVVGSDRTRGSSPAVGYCGCQILVEAIRRVGSLDSEKLRDAILKMDHNTVDGGFRVDHNGVQIGHKMLLFQWQDGKKVIVGPEELAAGKARFPTPPWSQRP
jgi:branched-chain amino acid transport system substrate-binding protein